MAANLEFSVREQKFLASMQKMSGAVGVLSGKVNIGLNKSLNHTAQLSRTLDRGFGRLGTRFKDFGRALSIGLTLPLALAAKSASDAFSEYDSLRRALQSYHPTLDGLNSRLAEMRSLARLPGLGFQEAIQGDVRLQAVGISAKQSTKILREFSNAIAQTGGGKQQLNEVTRQLGQMAAKGKVLSQDLRPIIENAPAVATALKKIFGTVSSKDISDSLEKNGKSSVDFINLLLGEMEKAPRVTGGWKNSLENLSDSLFVSKARMFEVANEVLGLNEKVDSFSGMLENLVDGFTALPKPVQALMLGLAGTAAVIGPLSYGMGSLIQILPKLLITANLTTVGIGAMALAIGALTAYVIAVRGETEAYNEMLNKHKTASTESANATSSELSQVERHVKTLINEKSSLDKVKNAKTELLKVSPEFNSALSSELLNIEALNGALNTYRDRLRAAAEAKVLGANLDELHATEAALKNGEVSFYERAQAFNKTASNFMTFLSPFGDASDITSQGDNTQAIIDKKLTEIRNAIEGNLDKHEALREKYGDLLNQTVSTSPDTGFNVNSIGGDIADTTHNFDMGNRKDPWGIAESIKKSVEEAKAILKRFNEWKTITLTASGISNVSKRGNEPLSMPQKLEAGLSERRAKNEEARQTQLAFQNRFKDDLVAFKEQMATDLSGMGMDFGANLVQGLVSGKGLKGALKGLLNDLGGYLIAYGKQMALAAGLIKTANTAFSLTPAKGIAQGLSLIAAGGIMKGFASNIPAIAQGGVTNSPLLAMIGDNASGKEMVMPWEKTGDFASKIASHMGGGAGGGNLTARIEGQDLLFILDRAKRNQG